MDELTPERWQQVRTLFEDALERPAGARTAFLAEVCAGDPALRAEVEALLAAEAQGDPLLHGSLESQAGALIGELVGSTDAPVSAGRRIGAYRILEELGRGGMSVVYLADRADGQFEQRVALKLIKRGMDTDLMLQRFQRERQILARLQHPHIARLYDGGVTQTGQPFFVMEHIRGEPLIAYADAHGLSVVHRLQLFIDVGEAVQYAHRRLVVHRDLKPSNILVTPEGEVKLLDFGIAKLLGEDEDDVLTRTGQLPMTPAYAAPEQLHGEPVTTATDVYALGLILYELLCGQRPFDAWTAYDREATSSHAPPPRPSSRAGRGTEASAEQQATAARIRRRLRGDLDTICLKALRQEPERRYPSVEAFVADVRRHLAGEPVAARPDTIGYRVRKFVGRHRVGMIAAAMVLLALVGGLTVAVWQAQIAQRERDAKELEAARATQTLEYVLDLFDSLDPAEAQGRTFTARELVAPGVHRLEALDDRPLVQAAIAQALGRTSESLGLFETADSLLVRAQTVQEDAGSDEASLAETYEARALVQLQLERYDEAQTLLERALAIRQSRYAAAADPAVIKTLNQFAYLYLTRGETAAADSVYRAALALRDQAVGELNVEVARSLRGLAEVYVAGDSVASAIPLFDEALGLYETLRGDAHSETSRARFGLAQAWRRAGDLGRADSLLRVVLQTGRRVYGPEHPRVATMLYHLGDLQAEAGRLDSAAVFYEASATIRTRALPPEHIHTAYAWEKLGTVRLREGRAVDALEALQRAHEIYDETAPGENVVRNSLNLAACLLALGRTPEAEELLLANHAKLDGWTEPESETLGFLRDQTRRGLIRIYEQTGRSHLAAPLLAESGQ